MPGGRKPMERTDSLTVTLSQEERARGTIARLDSLLERGIEASITMLMVVMVLLAFVQVVLRYVFDDPFAWNEEVARWSFVWMTFLGAVLGVKRNSHVRIVNLLTALP